MVCFKMSNDILLCAAAVDIRRSRRGDSAADYRMMIFIRLLMLAANGVNDLRNAKDLAAILGVKLSQTERVWDACVLHGVLRMTGEGFGALHWLKEHDYIVEESHECIL